MDTRCQQRPPDTIKLPQLPCVESIKKAISEAKEIGRGGNAVVYDTEHPDFVLRVLRGERQTSQSTGVQNEPTPVEDRFPGRNFGQTVGTLNGIQILKRQSGLPAGLSTKTASQEENDTRYAEVVTLAAQMPQSAYDGFARDLLFLHSAGAKFDPSKSNNVLIDTKAGRFNIVDTNDGNYKSGLEDMLIVLMGNTYASYYRGEKPLKEEYARIFTKAECAAKKVGLSTELGSSGDYSKQLAEGYVAPPLAKASGTNIAHQKDEGISWTTV